MQIAVIGTGFVGVVTAGVFSKFGNNVYALDVDIKKIKALQNGNIPFFEPNLEELILDNLGSGRLHFTSEYREAIQNADVVFICVGTPSASDGQADLSYVYDASKKLAYHLKKNAIVVIKSTVPPKTPRVVERLMKKVTIVPFEIAAVPEFLKEGSAVSDALNPERVIIGVYKQSVASDLLELHKPLSGKKIIMSPESAMMTKYASNAYLAIRIAFINEIANLCEKSGADIEEVIQGIGADRRIGSQYWYPGPGYGGSCFPKDVKELAAFAKSVGEEKGLFEKIDELNEKRIPRLLNIFEKICKGFKRKTICILGVSFKPNTDDMREAPSKKIVPLLLARGAKIRIYDPKALDAAKKLFGNSIEYAKSVNKAAKGADCLMILVEWDEFKQMDLTKIKSSMRGNIIFDTRNLYNPKIVNRHGFKYLGIGR